jgi:dUTPase
VAQLVIVAVAGASLHEVPELDATERGTSGFGSSGR